MTTEQLFSAERATIAIREALMDLERAGLIELSALDTIRFGNEDVTTYLANKRRQLCPS